MTGGFEVKNERMAKYEKLVEQLMKLFENVYFKKTIRLVNEATDELAKIASFNR